MKHFKNISTLIFDFGGVLINLDLNQCILNFKQLGIKNVEQYLGNFGQSGFFMQFEKGQISAETFRNEVRKMTPNTVSDAEIDRAWCSFLVEIPAEKLELLYELRKRFRVLMLSNTNIIHFPFTETSFLMKEGHTKSDYFDKCYLSYEMKMVKPDAEIFEKLLETEDVEASQCLFLDDGLKNIEQAKKLGMQTYLVNDREDLSFLMDNVQGLQ